MGILQKGGSQYFTGRLFHILLLDTIFCALYTLFFGLGSRFYILDYAASAVLLPEILEPPVPTVP